MLGSSMQLGLGHFPWKAAIPDCYWAWAKHTVLFCMEPRPHVHLPTPLIPSYGEPSGWWAWVQDAEAYGVHTVPTSAGQTLEVETQTTHR